MALAGKGLGAMVALLLLPAPQHADVDVYYPGGLGIAVALLDDQRDRFPFEFGGILLSVLFNASPQGYIIDFLLSRCLLFRGKIISCLVIATFDS